jgi:hypothetical protein
MTNSTFPQIKERIQYTGIKLYQLVLYTFLSYQFTSVNVDNIGPCACQNMNYLLLEFATTQQPFVYNLSRGKMTR